MFQKSPKNIYSNNIQIQYSNYIVKQFPGVEEALQRDLEYLEGWTISNHMKFDKNK